MSEPLFGSARRLFGHWHRIDIDYGHIERQALNHLRSSGAYDAYSALLEPTLKAGQWCLDTRLNMPVELLHWFRTEGLERLKMWRVETLQRQRYDVTEKELRPLTDMEVVAWSASLEPGEPDIA